MTGNNNQLRSLAKRRIHLEEERDALTEDIKAVNAEAKSLGYSPRVFSQAIKVARMTPEKRQTYDNDQYELESYLAALDGETE